MSTKTRKILVPQPEPPKKSSPYYQLAEEYGLELVFKPLFHFETLTTRQFRDQKVDILKHTAVILTSRTITTHFFKLVSDLRCTLPEDFKYFCASERVALFLQKFITVRKRKIFFPEKNGSSSDFQTTTCKHDKEKFLVPEIEERSSEVVAMLQDTKVKVDVCDVCRIIYADVTSEEIDSFDFLLFFSPNGLSAIKAAYPDYQQGRQIVGCLGEGTREELEQAGLQVHISAPTREYPSMTAALEHYLQEEKKAAE